MLGDARTALLAAAEEVSKSATALRTATTLELPIAAALQALHLARTAISTVGAVASSQTGAITSTLLPSISAGRERASEAVGTATEELTHAQTEVAAGRGGAVGLALRAADKGVDIALRQAANIDNALDITGKAAAIDRSLQLQERAVSTLAAAQAMASDVNTRYSLVDRAIALLDRAKTLDSYVSGGRATSLAGAAVTKSTELAGESLEYLKGAINKFEAMKVLGGGSGSGQPEAPHHAEQAH